MEAGAQGGGGGGEGGGGEGWAFNMGGFNWEGDTCAWDSRWRHLYGEARHTCYDATECGAQGDWLCCYLMFVLDFPLYILIIMYIVAFDI